MQKHSSYKTCCCIGHRKIEKTDGLEKEIYDYIENLIVNENVNVFLFGSRSEFDFLCQSVVADLKVKYPFIKRIGYTCKSESVTLESERKKWEKIYSHLEKKEIRLTCVDEEFEHKKKYAAGKAAYIERNQAMIENSDYCLFYYNEKYVVPQRNDGGLGYYRPKSGTALAYNYAKRKKKIIKNFYKN